LQNSARNQQIIARRIRRNVPFIQLWFPQTECHSMELMVSEGKQKYLGYDLRRCFPSCAPSKNCVGNIKPKLAEDMNVGPTRHMKVPTALLAVAELDSSCSSRQSRPARSELDDIYVWPVKQATPDNKLESLM
jgi:hypothetical protein